MSNDCGNGSGYGTGDNCGDGTGDPTQQAALYMEVDKTYLVCCKDWYAFVGRVIEMLSPVVYLMDNVSKISNIDKDCNIRNLDNNIDRDKATYLHYEGIVTIPLTIAAFEWIGETPKESDYARIY